MKLGYTIVYVPKVSDSLKFFSKTFGFNEKFLHVSGDYGEIDTLDPHNFRALLCLFVAKYSAAEMDNEIC